MFEMFPLCVGLQEHPSWCWQQAQAYLWPLSKRMATATRRPQDMVNQQLSQASAMACKDPSSSSPLTGWSFHPSIPHSPSPHHYPLALPSTGRRERQQTCLHLSFLVFFKLFFTPPPLKLPWRTQFYFCCQTKGLNHKDLISSHSVLTTLIFLMFILFEWEMVYVQWEGWYVGRAGLLQKKKPHKHTKVCCEASGLHSVVRRN